ncbi:unnamed protein product [Periconia digitata]|uniref:Uncharacterized protein n=1 Tax=Periconia digitata TaxID=1303443 RepID=A0A9W4U858_9PLEO|nr:unnamed protein product [Periconia digitata]
MVKTFHFVNAASDDRKERKEIRRHVMMGKNAGKTIHRPSKIKALKQKELEQRNSKGSLVRIAKPVSGWYPTPFPRTDPRTSVETEMKSMAFPVELTPQYIEIITDFFAHVADGMYPAHIGVSLEAAKCTWLRVMLLDEHNFHCSVALMQACNATFLYGKWDALVSATFLTSSISHVRKKIESPDALSCSTVAIVLSLVTQEQFRNEHEAARVHLGGLVRMINLRGGLDTLKETPQVLLKACKTDILFSLEYGNAPIFFRDRMADIRRLHKLQDSVHDLTTIPCIVQHCPDTRLSTIIIDVFDTCKLFNDPHHQYFEIDLESYQEIIVSVSYRLLTLRHIHQQPLSSTPETLYQLGLIIFIMILFLQYGRRRLHRFARISGLLKHVLELHSVQSDKDLTLWLMITGGIWMMDGVWTLDAHSGDWLPPLISGLAKEMGLQTWDDARSHIIKYPWIYKLLDGPGSEIWERVLAFRKKSNE